MSVDAVQKWESGVNMPRGRRMDAIADALGKPVSYFLEDNDDQPPSADTSPKTIRYAHLLPVPAIADTVAIARPLTKVHRHLEWDCNVAPIVARSPIGA